MKHAQSLKITLGLPLVLIVLVFATVLIVVEHLYLESARVKSASERAEIIAYAVQYTAEVAGDSPELNRVVQVLSTEKDVLSINVVLASGEVLASSRLAKRHTNVFNGHWSDFYLGLVNQRKDESLKDTSVMQADNTTLTFASPFIIALKQYQTIQQAVVIVDLDTTNTAISISQQIQKLVLIVFAVIVATLFFIFLLLNKYLFTPVSSILNAIKQRTTGQNQAFAKVFRDDQLGALALAYNELIALENEAREALLLREEELQLIFDNVPVRIWYKDDKNTILRLNQGAADSMNMPVGEVEGKNTADLFPEMADKYLKDDLEVIDSGQAKLNIIEKYTPKNADFGWVKTDKVPYFFKDNGKRGVLVVAQDITELKLAESKLQDSEERFTLAEDATLDGIWDWPNMDKDEEYWSPQWKRLLGYEDNEIQASASAFFNLLHPDDVGPTSEALEAHIQDKKVPFDIEYRLKTKNGAYKWFQARGKISENTVSGKRRMTGSIRDIERKKRAEHTLAQYTKELERSNQDLDEFAYIASHDLKAPLRSIDLLATWMLDDLAEENFSELKSNLMLMRQRAARMKLLLSDLLQYSKVGKQEEKLDTFDTQKVISEYFDLYAAPPEFTLAFVSSMPVFTTFTVPLGHVFQNLLSNALKHRSKDDGTISVSCQDAEDFYTFSVKDDGDGIDKKYHALIFKMFKSLKPRDEIEGSGMGLALVQKIVHFYGGEISVNSSKGEGAEFIFTWPKHISTQKDKDNEYQTR